MTNPLKNNVFNLYNAINTSHLASAGYYCNRGFNRETRLPTMLNKLFHMKTCKQRGKTTQTKGEKTKRSVGA